MGRLTGARGVFLGGLATFAALAVLVGLVTQSSASTPPSHTVTAPPPSGSVTVKWTGTIPPGAVRPSSCNAATPGDSHEIDLQVPDGLYTTATSQATFKISWADGPNDEILTVIGPDGESAPATAAATARSSPSTTSRRGTYTCSRAGSRPRARRTTPAS